MKTLAHNRAMVDDWTRTLPLDLRHHAPEATYLSWFDFGREAPGAHFERTARVKLSEGAEFADGTAVDTTTFARLNFATSPANLEEMLSRIAAQL